MLGVMGILALDLSKTPGRSGMTRISCVQTDVLCLPHIRLLARKDVSGNVTIQIYIQRNLWTDPREM